MVIFHSYVSLPEGNTFQTSVGRIFGETPLNPRSKFWQTLIVGSVASALLLWAIHASIPNALLAQDMT
jgi:hypothetical protein